MSSPLVWRLINGVIAALVVGVVIAIGIGICAARTALLAEENLQAFIHAHHATLDYIEQNEGRWPKSWNDLRFVRPESDFSRVTEHVTFDFDADPNEIATQTPQTFSAVTPHKPCYHRIDFEVQQLIDALNRYSKSD